MRNSSNRRAARTYNAENPWRHACCAKAHAIQVLPAPVGPLRMMFWALRIQSQLASVATTRWSKPRLCRTSMSSIQACGFFSLAAFIRRSRRRVSRQASSRSTTMPNRSSNDRLVLAVSAACSSKARAMPSSFRFRSCERVCCINMVTSFGSVIIVRPAHVLVFGGLPLSEFDRQRCLAVQSGLEDREDRATCRGADHEGALTCRFKALATVFAGQRQQSQTSPVAHFGMRAVGQQVPDDRLGAGANGGTPVQQAPGRPLQVSAVSYGHVL